MDSLHAIGFYVSATVLVGAALLVALLPARAPRGLAMAGVGVGLAGLDFALSAGLTGTVALVCYAAIAWIVAGKHYRAVEVDTGALWRQVAAVAAAGILALGAYSALRGAFLHATYYGGALGGAAVGRLLFAHDALATDAVGALVLVALVGAAVAWRSRERTR
jgi:hypothetical protein